MAALGSITKYSTSGTKAYNPATKGYVYFGPEKTPTQIGFDVLSYKDPALEDWSYYDGHDGHDFGILGDALAAAPGVVAFAGNSGNTFGLMVDIYHPEQGYLTRYAHLAEIYVTKGQKIDKPGFPIGKIGGSGTENGVLNYARWQPHLHFSVFRWNSNWQRWQVTDPFGWDPWAPDLVLQNPSADPLTQCNGEISHVLWAGGWPQQFGGPSTAAFRPAGGRYIGGWYNDTTATTSQPTPSLTPEPPACSDTEAPSVSWVVQGKEGRNGWRIEKPVTVTFTVTDPINCGGEPTLNVGIAGGALSRYAGALRIDREGVTNVEYEAADPKGNRRRGSFEIKIDTIKPEVRSGKITSSFTTRVEVVGDIARVVIKATDAEPGSGVEAIFVSVNGGDMVRTEGDTATVELRTSGIYSIASYTVDRAGWESPKWQSGPIVVRRETLFTPELLELSKTTTVTINGETVAYGGVKLDMTTGTSIPGPLTIGQNATITRNADAGTAIATPTRATTLMPLRTYSIEWYEQRAVVFTKPLLVDDTNVLLSGMILAPTITLFSVGLGGQVAFIARTLLTDKSTGTTVRTADPGNGAYFISFGDIVIESTGLKAFGMINAFGTLTIGPATGARLDSPLVAKRIRFLSSTDVRVDFPRNVTPVQELSLPLTQNPLAAAIAPLPAAPGVPGSLAAGRGAANPSVTTITWQPGRDAVGTEIEVSKTPDFAPASLVVDVARIGSYHLANLPAGTYYIRARSRNRAGASAWSAVVTYTMGTTTTSTPTPSPTPTAQPDFTLGVAPTSVTGSAGRIVTLQATVTALGGFNTSVTVTLSGLPPGSMASPTMVLPLATGTTVPLSIILGSTRGTFPVTVTAKGTTATGTTITRSASVQLTVQ